jgi:hypothetical protein
MSAGLYRAGQDMVVVTAFIKTLSIKNKRHDFAEY